MFKGKLIHSSTWFQICIEF